ncbi:MAG TPA: NAD(P)/FAD-dependent oxidoreductase [Solirubrobacterales bacterium]|nr:NAD(P)/FAD-dependent oxidoreductase [Solirubrobacterales bacterium]
MSEATVVGSGPNGLACAVALARAGVRVTVLEAAETIGGGVRTAELTVPGLIHDLCSATHPMAAASPFLQSLGLEEHGLEWRWPEVDLAHPLDDGSAATMVRSLEETAAGLGPDGRVWKRLFGSTSAHFDALADDMLGPVIHLPRHPILLARLGLPALMPVTVLTRRWQTPGARALFGGVAAHSFSPLTQTLSSAVGMALTTACHGSGWPVAAGGSQSIADALAADLREHGGSIETGVRVRSLAELGSADVVAFDLAPGAAAEIAGDRLPGRTARAYQRYKHGPGAFKVDLAVEGGIPWTADACRRAGTVHAIGSFEELVAAEREVNNGHMPPRPFVLVGQQYLADPSRSAGNVHPIWAYAHVPSGYDGDGEKVVIDQIERFAPGLRERIVATASRSPAELEAGNPNYISGDIICGANTPFQTVVRPRLARDPYSTGSPGLFICSAATPPGGGVHGMSGFHAAQSALRYLARTT